nr:MAG TPA: hypothetical protein [Caudoviricetes sp.]
MEDTLLVNQCYQIKLYIRKMIVSHLCLITIIHFLSI